MRPSLIFFSQIEPGRKGLPEGSEPRSRAALENDSGTQVGYFLGELFFAGCRAVLAALFFAATGLVLFGAGVYLTLLFLIAGFFAVAAAFGFFDAGTAFATGFFTDLADRVAFFAITVFAVASVWVASSPLCANSFGVQAFWKCATMSLKTSLCSSINENRSCFFDLSFLCDLSLLMIGPQQWCGHTVTEVGPIMVAIGRRRSGI